MRWFILFFIFFFLLVDIFAEIDGLRAEYDYSEFIIEDIPLGVDRERKSISEVSDSIISFRQIYQDLSFLHSSFTREDSLTAIVLSSHYWDNLKRANFAFALKDRHKLDISYYDWEHKEDINYGKLLLGNSFGIINKETYALILDSDIALYQRHRKRDSEFDYSGYSFKEDLSFLTDSWGISAGFHYPYQLVNKNNRSLLRFIKRRNNLLTSVGISQVYHQGGSYYNPVFSFRYVYKNVFIFRFRSEEVLESYPFDRYLHGNAFYFKSRLAADKEMLEPVRSINYELSSDFYFYDMYHSVKIGYRRARGYYDYVWRFDSSGQPEYMIERIDNDRDILELGYEIRRNTLGVKACYRPLGSVDFQPQFTIGFDAVLFYNVFNELQLRLAAHYNEAESFFLDNISRNKANYESELTYRYIKIPDIVIESGIVLNTLRYKKSFFDNNPSFFLGISYGKQ